jgi:hypothetical protein
MRILGLLKLSPRSVDRKGLEMDMGEWWKYVSGFVVALGGAVIKDAIRDGEIKRDLANLKETVGNLPKCAGEVHCFERRKECNSAMRREFDAGAAQFTRLELCIQKVDENSQKRHTELLMALMDMNKS